MSTTKTKKQISPLAGGLINNYLNREAAAKPQTWEAVEGFYQDIANGVVSTATGIDDHLSILKAYRQDGNEIDVSEINVLVSTYNKDLDTIVSQLSFTHNKHKGMSGVISDNDYQLYLEVFNEYVLAHDQYKALIFPLMLSLTEKVMEVSTKEKKKQEAADITTVTDVEVKETV